MTFECENCEYRTMDLGNARSHYIKTGHSEFRVYAGIDQSYGVKISN